ncbi:hypothetical protein GCWU000324_00388 [Kingella oralis ATCC 51147]|uniref:Uncharacterized protein n=1 Tax=Kingella oralis ATCC 51147 TaxID=629741 RepID=C4GHQ4_9NEIS|nr:hypothetical protein GCWU000324_00388 [Kingella oralis ATCC 51147]
MQRQPENGVTRLHMVSGCLISIKGSLKTGLRSVASFQAA